MIPGKLDADGRLCVPMHDEGVLDRHILEYPTSRGTMDLSSMMPPQEEVSAAANRPKRYPGRLEPSSEACREWVDRLRGRFDLPPGEMLDTVLLLFMGFATQRARSSAAAIGRDDVWVRPRVARLRAMGLWRGGARIGSRFDCWLGRGDRPGLECYLDLLEISGKISSDRNTVACRSRWFVIGRPLVTEKPRGS